MKRKLHYFLAAAGMSAWLLSSQAWASGSESAVENSGFETETETSPDTKTPDAPEDTAKTIQLPDSGELAENLDMILNVLNSEDFQSLFSYQEVRELAEVVIVKAADFAMTEPDLTGKICETMGVDPSTANLVVSVLRSVQENRDDLGSVIEALTEEETAQLKEAADLVMNDPELMGDMLEIVNLILG